MQTSCCWFSMHYCSASPSLCYLGMQGFLVGRLRFPSSCVHALMRHILIAVCMTARLHSAIAPVILRKCALMRPECLATVSGFKSRMRCTPRLLFVFGALRVALCRVGGVLMRNNNCFESYGVVSVHHYLTVMCFCLFCIYARAMHAGGST